MDLTFLNCADTWTREIDKNPRFPMLMVVIVS